MPKTILFNNENIKRENIKLFQKITIILFSFFPISFVLGNSLINLNILLINFLLLYYSYTLKDWEWLKDKFFKLLIIFYFYIVINSVIFHFLNDYSNYDGLTRSLSFIKFILLAYSLQVLIYHNKTLDTIIKNWLVIIGIIIVDVFFEKIIGHNIFGNISPDHSRIVSFFDDELIVGGLIFCYGFIIATYFLQKNLNFKSKIFFNLFLFIVPFSVFISGERANFIKSFIIFSIVVFLIDNKKLLIDKKIFVFFTTLIIFATIFFNETIRIKQVEVFKRILISKDVDKYPGRFQNIKYFAHYDVAIKIFKDFPFSGVSSKNFRYVCRDTKYFDQKIKFSFLRCNTHPHQIHLEILSEHGLIGYLFLFYLFFYFFKKKLADAKLTNNIFYSTSVLYLIIFFIPLLPGGAIFSTTNGALFWIVFSIANINFKKIPIS